MSAQKQRAKSPDACRGAWCSRTPAIVRRISMLSQSTRNLFLCGVLIALVGSLDIAPVSAASDREILKRIDVQTHPDKRLEGTRVHIVVQDGRVVLSGTVYLYSQKMLYEHI